MIMNGLRLYQSYSADFYAHAQSPSTTSVAIDRSYKEFIGEAHLRAHDNRSQIMGNLSENWSGVMLFKSCLRNKNIFYVIM